MQYKLPSCHVDKRVKHSAFSESGNCVPILRLCTRVTQSRECVAPVRNLEITQFLLRAQVVIRFSIVYKGKECM